MAERATITTKKGEKVWIKVRTSHLCNLFGCSPDTLRRWVRQKKIDPTSLESLIKTYNNKEILDKRRKRNASRKSKGEKKV